MYTIELSIPWFGLLEMDTELSMISSMIFLIKLVGFGCFLWAGSVFLETFLSDPFLGLRFSFPLVEIFLVALNLVGEIYPLIWTFFSSRAILFLIWSFFPDGEISVNNQYQSISLNITE